jgi:hypothetical protein
MADALRKIAPVAGRPRRVEIEVHGLEARG